MKKVIMTLILVIIAFVININPVYALGEATKKSSGSQTVSSAKSSGNDCGGVFGSTSDPEAFAYYLQGAFNIMKFLGPILLFVLSILDLVKITAEQKQDDQLVKLAGKTLKRAVYAVLIFVLPDLINYIFGLVGLYGTCGIS